MVRAAVLVSGGGANLQAILDVNHFAEIPNFSLVAVISSNPEAHALTRAQSARVPAYVIDRDLFPNRASFGNALLGKLQDLDIELVITAGFKERLGYAILHKYKNRVINVQPALFPAFCDGGFDAMDALQKTLALGVRISGATAYFMTEEDNGTGPIIAQKPVAVRSGDTLAELQARIMHKGEWAVLTEAIKLFCAERLSVSDSAVEIAPDAGAVESFEAED